MRKTCVLALVAGATVLTAGPASGAVLKPISLQEGKREAKRFARNHARDSDALDYSVYSCYRSGKYRVICTSYYELEETYCYAKIRVTKTARYYNGRQYGASCEEY